MERILGTKTFDNLLLLAVPCCIAAKGKTSFLIIQLLMSANDWCRRKVTKVLVMPTGDMNIVLQKVKIEIKIKKNRSEH